MSTIKILITGSSGFIGTDLVKFLISKNIEIHNIDKVSYCSIPDKFTSFPKKKYFFYRTDLLKINKIKKILLKVKPEVIIKLAADSHVDRSIDAPGKFIKNNIISCLNLLECIKKNKRKIKLKKFINTFELKKRIKFYEKCSYSNYLTKII